MFDLAEPWTDLVVRSAIVYAAVLLGFRVTGKRQIGQMAPFDLVLILLIANAVQNAMVGSDTSLWGGLIAAGTLLLLNLGTARLSDSFGFFRRLTEGEPVVLVSHGTVLTRALRHENIDREELDAALREHGVQSIEDVELAVLEIDGTISVVPGKEHVVRTRRRFRGREDAPEPR